MPWFDVDDSAHSHPKMVKAGNAAVGLWTRCGSYAAQHLTDGIVPGAIASMYGTRPQAEKLLRVGLWHRAGHGCPRCAQPAPEDFVMHDYRFYNPTRKQVLERRARAAEKKRKQRAGVADGPPDPPEPLDLDEEMGFENAANRSVFDDESKRFHRPDSDNTPAQHAASRGDSSETRARAFPSPPLTTDGSQRENSDRSTARATHEPLSAIPHDWQPTQDDIAAAQAARTATGRPVLTGAQLADVTRKYVRRQTSDARQLPTDAWGPRWQEWAERERPTDTTQPPLLLGLNGGQAPWPHEQPEPAQATPAAPPLQRTTCAACEAPFPDKPPTDRLCRQCRTTRDQTA